MKQLSLALVMAFSSLCFAQDKKADTAKAKDSKDKGKQMIAVMDTSMGPVTLKLFNDKAPKTVENFVGLAEGTKEFTDDKGKKQKKPYYNGTVFHRVIDGFMIQGGDPTGTGSGGPGYTIKDEIHPELKHSKKGILAMAKTAAPDSGGSQFYITLGPTSHLDGIHTVFGEVTSGMDVVEKIGKTPVDASDRPKTPVTIKSIKIERK